MNTKINSRRRNRYLAISVFAILAIGFLSLNSQVDEKEDSFLWLEEIEGEKQLEWVKEHNTATFNYLMNTKGYQERYDFRYKTLISKEKLAMPRIRDGYIYNYWQDDKYPRGVWRRKEFEQYINDQGEWELVLDIGILSEEEGTNWVFNGVSFPEEGINRCVLHLSKGGSDAIYIREFDLEEMEFIDTGFTVEEAKSSFDWIDIDNVYVATDFGEGSMTTSGYPRIVKRWERETPIEEATIVFEADENDMGAFPIVMHCAENKYEFIYHAMDFYHFSLYIVKDGDLVKIELPDDFTFDIFHDQLIVQPMVDWKYGENTITSNQVVGISFQDIDEKNYKYKLIFEAPERVSVEDFSVTETHVLINTLNNISSELLKFSFQEGVWNKEIVDLPNNGSISIVSSEAYKPYYFVTYESFIQPTTLYCDRNDDESPLNIMSYPVYFDASDLVVNQYETASKDGTMIPYFIVHDKNLKMDGNNPLILYGYGGFQISEKPYYGSSLGKLWLNEGGVYVLANIRGGGEFGPSWHKSAILENKQKSYDDFIAIAEDVINRKISSADKIGITGGSNGGLLVGAVMVQRPELFKAVASFVPLLDMKRYSKLLAGQSWVAEYGDPDIPEQWEYISKYSPYQNLKHNVEYPVTFFLTSTRDDRVHPGHARKMTAKMEAFGNEVYLFENTEGGHAATVTPEQKARLTALYYSFFVDQLMDN
jgi:prolyl oligopeptidase